MKKNLYFCTLSCTYLRLSGHHGTAEHVLIKKKKIPLLNENARTRNLNIKTGVSSFTGNFVLSSYTLSKKEDVIELGKFVIT